MGHSKTYLGIRQVIQSLLVGRVSLLEVVHHQIAMTWGLLVGDVIGAAHGWDTKTAPDFAVVGVDFYNVPQILDGSGELLQAAQDARNGLHGRDRPVVVSQGMVVALLGALVVVHHLGQAAWWQSVWACL